MKCSEMFCRLFLVIFMVLFAIGVRFQAPSAVSPVLAQPYGPFPDGTTVFVSVDNTSGVEDGSQEHPFNTIQEGIDAATSSDVVGVASGTYYENVTLTAGVQLRGMGADATTIDGGGSGTVVEMQDASVIEGFTVQNGAAYWGAGINTNGAPIMMNNVIKDNHQYNGGAGGAIHGNNSSPSILGNIIEGNTGDQQWTSGAVSFVNASSPYIANNILRNNSGRGTINLTLPVGNTPTIVNNTIVGNSGAGIKIDARVSQSTVTVANNILSANTTGLLIDFGSDANLPSFVYNDVFDNTTDYVGVGDQTGINGNISLDPLFGDTAASSFRLMPGSPAIDAGTNTGAPATDFYGNRRPIDGDGDGIATTDIGANEFLPRRIYLPMVLKKY